MTTENTKPSGLLYSCTTCSKWIPEETAIASKYKNHDCHFCDAKCHAEWCAKQKENEQKAEEIL